MATELPETFRSPMSLRVVNVVAVASSLSALTALGLAPAFETASEPGIGEAICGSTFLYGLVWATLLRSRRTVGRTSVRWGWIASVPLAAANSGTACALWCGTGTFKEFVSSIVFGSTLGAILWAPALVVTLVCFGVPIAWAQKLAKQGLAGEDIGELIVGLVSAMLGFAAFAALATTDAPLVHEPYATAMFRACSMLGLVAGAAAATIAYRREKARRKFVQEVLAGNVEGYRVDEADQGKVLVRVAAVAEGYRVASHDVPVYGLSEVGAASRPIEVDAERGKARSAAR